jgi:hypothetical protein
MVEIVVDRLDVALDHADMLPVVGGTPQAAGKAGHEEKGDRQEGQLFHVIPFLYRRDGRMFAAAKKSVS